LVPAHNESSGLLPTLADIQKQLHPGDRLLVVADNCTDDTADVASAAGAEVIARHDPARSGKGYALDFGVRHLASSDPPEIVIVIDADCRLADCTIDRLATACASTHRPVQALDLMTGPAESKINHQVAEFAWRVKNWVRPLGLSALGLPCQLMGTGMAFPWDVIRSTNIGSGQIVEDLEIGLNLALAGMPPLFCPAAVVTSSFPVSVVGAERQRRRWELGHIAMILKSVPRLLPKAFANRNWCLLGLVLDLAVPPLSLLALLIAGMSALIMSAAFFGFAWAALIISTASLVAFITAVCLAWAKWGRDVLPLRAVFSIAPYVFMKLGLYRKIVSADANAEWVRTDRSKPE
ncbi:MAG TPA: glycosyltransferase family 2 protein, partial [Terriglobales bacterium]|nr:glycosyltransferase family 2 protein [Terriglobales bacterium]